MENELLRKYIIELLFFSVEFVNPTIREIISHNSELGLLETYLNNRLQFPIDDIDKYIITNYKKYVKIDEKYNANYHSGYDDDQIFEIICREIKIN